MRVSLIGPLPPELGGATPGGVATHQAHLAAGLAHVPGVHAALLATNIRCAAPQPKVPYALHTMRLPDRPHEWLEPGYLGAVGPLRMLRYAAALARQQEAGSRREHLAHLLCYRHFLAATHPDVVHVQHPLERAFYVRRVFDLEQRRRPLVVTAHSFFGEHA